MKKLTAIKPNKFDLIVEKFKRDLLVSHDRNKEIIQYLTNYVNENEQQIKDFLKIDVMPRIYVVDNPECEFVGYMSVFNPLLDYEQCKIITHNESINHAGYIYNNYNALTSIIVVNINSLNVNALSLSSQKKVYICTIIHELTHFKQFISDEEEWMNKPYVSASTHGISGYYNDKYEKQAFITERRYSVEVLKASPREFRIINRTSNEYNPED